MLTKMVNGKECICSEQEEKVIRDFWDFNSKYPKYRNCNSFDGVNPCKIDLSIAIQIHQQLLKKAVEIELNKLKDKIEEYEENNFDTFKLISDRRSLKAIPNMDLSSCKTVQDLIDSVPIELKSYWS